MAEAAAADDPDGDAVSSSDNCSANDTDDDGLMNEELGRALDELGYEERPTTRWQ